MEMVIDNTTIKKYPAYKDSGVEWLGEIPSHWVVSRLKNHVEMITGFPFKSEKYTESGVKLARGINVKEGVFNWDETRYWPTVESHLEGYLLAEGDILIAMDGSKVGKNFCKVKSEDLPILLLQRVARLRAKSNLDCNYLFNNVLNRNFLLWVEMSKTDPMVPHIAPSDIDNFLITVPPLPEQTAIADFLDRKTALIDQAIGIKQKQIELLKERRQILIHKAVTRGLNPNVKMKDSGVEWIGEIPEGWEVKKLKYCLNGKLKYGANESGIEYDISLPRYVRITDFGQDGKLSEDNKLSLSWKQGKDYLLKDGDILFARSGATVGKTYQFKKSMSVESEYSFAGYLIKAESNEEIILSDFLYLYTNSNLFNKWKEGIFIKATIENIGADKYSQLQVIIPPVTQQKEILSKFKEDDGKFSTAISLKEQEIEKLKEYKATLINSAVTGKIKVF